MSNNPNKNCEFAASSAHQLHTLLSGLKWALTVLPESGNKLSAEQRKIIALSIASVNNMISIVSTMLEAVKPGTVTPPLSTELLSFKNLVKEVMDDLALIARQKQISLKIDASGDFIIEAYHADIKQALINVVDNALRHSQKPGSEIVISGSVYGPNATISVSDKGIWVSRKRAKNARPENSGKTRIIDASVSGFGLGLYFTKQIIERHGGSMKIFSGKQGTTVTLRLPAKPQP